MEVINKYEGEKDQYSSGHTFHKAQRDIGQPMQISFFSGEIDGRDTFKPIEFSHIISHTNTESFLLRLHMSEH